MKTTGSCQKLVVLTAGKYTFLDDVVPFLWSFRRWSPRVDLKLYACTNSWDAVVLDDDFHEGMLRALDVEFGTVFECVSRGSQTKRPGPVLFAAALLDALVHRKPLIRKLKSRMTCSRVAEEARQVYNLLCTERPDAILADDRIFVNKTNYVDGIVRFLRESGARFIVRDHGLFRRTTGHTEFPVFDGIAYENWCSQMVPRADEAGLQAVNAYNLGSSGLDSEWLEYLSSCKENAEREPQCLYLIRKVLPPDASPGQIIGDIDYQCFCSTTRCLLVDSGLTERMQVIVKPYPTMDTKLLHRALTEAGLKSFKIDKRSIYAFVGTVDLVIGELTGAALVPYFAGVPCVMMGYGIESQRREHPDASLGLVRDTDVLNPGWYYHLEKPEELRVLLTDIWDSAGELRSDTLAKIERGMAYMRTLFPDKAAERCFDRLQHCSLSLAASRS